MLEKLVAPLSPRRFLAEHWPGRAFVGRGPVERFAALQRIPELASVESLARVASPGLVEAWFTGTSVGIDPGDAPRLLRSGTILYFRGLRSSVPALESFALELETDLSIGTGSVTCEAFVGTPGGIVAPHVDDHVGFNVQLSGRKRWRIMEDSRIVDPANGITEGEPVALELRRQGFDGDARMPTPDQSYETEAGDVTFVHTSMWHATEILPGGVALGLVFGVRAPSWLQLATSALARSLEQLPRWRRSAYEIGSADPAARQRVSETLGALLAELPDLAGDLGLADVARLESTPYLEGARRFLPRQNLRLRAEPNGTLHVEGLDQTLELSAPLAGAATALLGQEKSYTGRQALELAHPMQPRRVSTLLRWLERKGAVERLRPAPR